MASLMQRVLLYSILPLILWYSQWRVSSAPTKNKFDPNKYVKRNFSLSKADLSEVASILGEINDVALRLWLDWVGGLSEVVAVEASNSAGGEVGSNSTTVRANQTDHYLFEGDILLSPSQANGILDDLLSQTAGDESQESRRRRSAVMYDQLMKWPTMPIKYTFDPSIGPYERRAIDEGLEFWRTHTCIWFQHDPDAKNGDYISFFKGGDDSCFSHVGKIGGKQPISIGRNCGKMGYVAHEIGHALGMWHEQARPDSDSHVRVLWQNVKSDMTSNFLKRSWQQTETYGIPYDMGSVMHYGPYAFSSNDKSMTIETIVPGYRSTIGQREAPSFLDVKAVNKLYCAGKCQVQYPCSNGGYTHPGFCNTCLCPDGLGGTYCDQAEPSKNAACGGLVYVNDDYTNISSPNYPDLYRNNQRCSWLLRSPVGTRVVLEFVDIFQLGCAQTCTDYVEVKNDTQFVNTGMRFCCFEKPTYQIYSQTNEMIVIFNSGFTTFKGFKATVTQYPHSR